LTDCQREPERRYVGATYSPLCDELKHACVIAIFAVPWVGVWDWIEQTSCDALAFMQTIEYAAANVVR
jgi:hypothetical protein